MTTTLPYVEYLWPFDSTYQDLSLTFNATPINGAGFNSSTITGYGSSLSLSSASSQAVTMDAPFLNLSAHSWTFEVWIYSSTLLNSSDYAIIGQCESQNTDKCLHLVIRSQKLYFGFFGDDVVGQTTLMRSHWYHVACVFDSVTFNQSIYLNGVLDNSRTTNSYYSGNNGSLTVGMSFISPTSWCFDGFIDQLYYIDRVKTSAEILDDATLTLYFSFDNGSIYDAGPLRINGSLFGSTSVVTGRIGDAFQFGLSTISYFRVSGLVLLGTSNQSYSMSIWINPSVITSSTIVTSQSIGGIWCLGMLDLTSSGQIVATSWRSGAIQVSGPTLKSNNWTHVATTYNAVSGLCLYVNGYLRNSTVPFSYSASNLKNYLFLANDNTSVACTGKLGQFVGALDEFRLYSRELTASDVWTLANP